MTNQTQESQPQNAIFLGRVLTVMANRVTTELVAFSSWMIVGFSATLALLLANLDTVSGFIEPSTVGTAIKLFAMTILLHVLQRYLAAIVMAGAAVGKELEAIPIDSHIDVPWFMRKMEEATLWPTRYMVRWSNRKVLAGDFSVSGRQLAVLAQVQAWLVLAQILAVGAAALCVANSLQS